MSIESANEFWKHVQSDSQFRDKLKSATGEQELSAVIIGAGFQVTGEELQTSLTEWTANASDARELSDAELESVAGGAIMISFGAFRAPDIQNGINIVGRGGKG